MGRNAQSCVLHEDALAVEVHEELATAEVLQDQVELPVCLERVVEVHDERELWGRATGQVSVSKLASVHMSFRLASNLDQLQDVAL